MDDREQVSVAYARYEWTCPHCDFVHVSAANRPATRMQECLSCEKRVYVRDSAYLTTAEYLEASYRDDDTIDDDQPFERHRSRVRTHHTPIIDQVIQPSGMDYITHERAMQVRKGYTRERNIARDGWRSLVRSGDCYFTARLGDAVPEKWDLVAKSWHPRGSFWNLVRAGALYASALEIVTGGPEEDDVRKRVAAAAAEIDRLLWEVSASAAETVVTREGLFLRAMAYNGSNADIIEKWAYPVWKRAHHPVVVPIASLGLSVGDYVMRLPDGAVSSITRTDWFQRKNEGV